MICKPPKDISAFHLDSEEDTEEGKDLEGKFSLLIS